jgi:hypothetical protein
MANDRTGKNIHIYNQLPEQNQRPQLDELLEELDDEQIESVSGGWLSPSYLNTYDVVIVKDR